MAWIASLLTVACSNWQSHLSISNRWGSWSHHFWTQSLTHLCTWDKARPCRAFQPSKHYWGKPPKLCSASENCVPQKNVYLSVTCYNHNELLPCLQTNWRDSGYIWKFSLGLETNLAGITTIVLWGSHLLPSGHENFHDDAVSDLVDVPRIVSEEIWTQLPGMCLLQSVFCKVNSCWTTWAWHVNTMQMSRPTHMHSVTVSNKHE